MRADPSSECINNPHSALAPLSLPPQCTTRPRALCAYSLPPGNLFVISGNGFCWQDNSKVAAPSWRPYPTKSMKRLSMPQGSNGFPACRPTRTRSRPPAPIEIVDLDGSRHGRGSWYACAGRALGRGDNNMERPCPQFIWTTLGRRQEFMDGDFVPLVRRCQASTGNRETDHRLELCSYQRRNNRLSWSARRTSHSLRYAPLVFRSRTDAYALPGALRTGAGTWVPRVLRRQGRGNIFRAVSLYKRHGGNGPE